MQTECYEGFVSYDEDGQIQPAAADHWDVNDEATEYTFYIRDDEKWSDGSDVTSEDFENTIHGMSISYLSLKMHRNVLRGNVIFQM